MTASLDGEVRIPRGTLRGRRISFPAVKGLRPTSARTLEALLSSIQDRGDGAFIDAFAGSGVVALSAWSMGFSPVIAFEKHAAAAARLDQNANRLGASIDLRVGDIAKHWGVLTSRDCVTVFVDPPFSEPEWYARLQKMCLQIKADSVWLICEHESSIELTLEDGIEKIHHRRYGRSTLTYLEVKCEPRHLALA